MNRESLNGKSWPASTICHSRFPIVFPMHPRTRKMLSQFGILPTGNGAFHVLDPGKVIMIQIFHFDAKRPFCVLTDSGGLQEESTYLRTPCLTLRPNTERPITITHGSNRLTEVSRLSSDIEDVLKSASTHERVPLFWDGKAAVRVVDAIIEHDQILRRNQLPR